MLFVNPEKSLASAADLGVPRAYASFAEMAAKEARRKDGIEAVAIVTPNHMHAPVAMQFLRRGIHVICDKPLTATLAEAKRLAKAAADSGVVFALTHNYTGYPMVRHARAMMQAGDLGEIRVVQVEYAQDWLAEPIGQTGQKQADGAPTPRNRARAAAPAISGPMPSTWRASSPG
jgi:predicted dehydrogenase